ncbi:MAG: ABC-F family ATP-binding cassette domain-containing protein, partial [Bacilli bacterium]|nr:ABC-F family ATP-binding cassette domain-containing protein [Bacilli bacterium]
RYELLLKRYDRQQKEIQHLQSFVDRFRYKASKAKSAQDRIKKLDRIDRIDKPKKINRKVNVHFSNRRPTDAVILEVNQMTIGYEAPLLKKLDFKMRGTEKIGIIGPNGVGKTTFVKTLLGKIQPLSGNYEFVKNLNAGYFDQMASKQNYNGTVIEVLHGLYPQKTLYEVRSILAHFLFIGEDVFKEISVLSGGELVRMRLMLLMLERPEMLILDEPTNHLDIDTKNIVEDVFEEYDGPIIFISHDRYFINKVANRILVFEANKWELFEGNYDMYKAEIAKRANATVKKTTKIKQPINPEKEIEKLERQIEVIASELEVLKTELFDPEVYSDHVKYKQKTDKIAILEADSEEMLEKIESLSAETRE